VVNATLGGRQHVNVFHCIKTTSTADWTQAEINALATGFRTAYSNDFKSLLHADFALGDVIATDIGSFLGKVGVQTGTGTGSHAGSPMPNNVALGITWKVALHYRGGHPRSYFSGLVLADCDGHTRWVTTTLNNWDSAANVFLGDVNNITIGTGKAVLVSVHRTINREHLDEPITAPIVGARIDPRIDSQRRRLGPDVP
jgi:hypothetical protein